MARFSFGKALAESVNAARRLRWRLPSSTAEDAPLACAVVPFGSRAPNTRIFTEIAEREYAPLRYNKRNVPGNADRVRLHGAAGVAACEAHPISIPRVQQAG